MFKRKGLVCLAALAAPVLLVGGAVAQQRKTSVAPNAATAAPLWKVDKAQSRIRFKSSFGGVGFEGGFNQWDARINFDPKNLAASKAVVTIELASANSGNRDRDESLPGRDWFNVASFPRAIFTTTSFRDLGGGRYQALGYLSMKGMTRPVVLPFSLRITNGSASMNGSFALMRNQWSVGQGQFAASDSVPYPVEVNVTLTAAR